MSIVESSRCFFWDRLIAGPHDVCHPSIIDPLVPVGLILLAATAYLYRNSDIDVRTQHLYALGTAGFLLSTPLLLPIVQTEDAPPETPHPIQVEVEGLQCLVNVDAGGER